MGGMWPVGSKGCVPDQGVAVITDELSLKRKILESPGQGRVFQGLYTNH